VLVLVPRDTAPFLRCALKLTSCSAAAAEAEMDSDDMMDLDEW